MMVAALIFPSLLINENAPVYMHIKKGKHICTSSVHRHMFS